MTKAALVFLHAFLASMLTSTVVVGAHAKQWGDLIEPDRVLQFVIAMVGAVYLGVAAVMAYWQMPAQNQKGGTP